MPRRTENNERNNVDWFTVDRASFVDALKRVRVASGTNPSQDLLKYVLLTASDGVLRLSCGYTAFGVTVELPATAEEGLNGYAVSVQEVYQFVRLMTEKDLQVKVNKCFSCVVFGGGKSVLRMPFVPEHDMPELTVADKGSMSKVDPVEFSNAIKAVSFCTHRDAQGLSGVHVEREGEYLRFVSTDGLRLAIAEIECGEISIPPRVILPTGPLISALKTINEEESCSIGYAGNVFIIRSGQSEATFETAPSTFPKYRTIIPPEFAVDATVVRESLLPFLKRGGLITRKAASRFSLDEGVLTVEAESDTGTCEEKMSVECTGSCNFGMMPSHLHQAVTHIEGESVKIQANNEMSPVVVRGASNRRLFVVMPMRVY